MVDNKVLAEIDQTWPSLFGPEGMLDHEAVQEVIAEAYSIELVTSDSDLPAIRFGFAFDTTEVYEAFQCGADLVGKLLPDEIKVTCITLDGGYIVYADVVWDPEYDD